MTRRIHSLDWLRGIASIWVVLHHAAITAEKPKYFNLEQTPIIFQAGYHGVDIFFLLSGFVMAAAYQHTKPTELEFLSRRIFRIFPLYLSIFVPLGLMMFFAGMLDEKSAAFDIILKNLLLLPRDDLTTYVPVVAWTLTHELMFYALFSLIFLIGKRAVLIFLAIWGLSGLVFWLADITFSGFAMLLSPFNILFFIGVLIHEWRAHLIRLPSALLTLFILCGVSAGMAFEYFSIAQLVPGSSEATIFSSIAYTAGFAAIVSLLSRGTLRIPDACQKIAETSGRFSYGIYLIHYPVMVVFAIIISSFDIDSILATIILILATLLATFALSAIAFKFVEAPGMAFGKRLPVMFRHKQAMLRSD